MTSIHDLQAAGLEIHSYDPEQQKPESLEDAYQLTHAATEAFNELAEAFYDNDSEIETVARDAIAVDVETILKVYGFENPDLEEALAPREW